MRVFVLSLALMVAPFAASGAGGGGDLMDANVDVHDRQSLQRGAKLFANYCMGCHSLKYLRYNRVAQDLDIPEDLVEQYLIWDGSKIQSTMTNAMRTEDGKDWFGKAPPDLSLTARAKGPNWIYTYLNSYYRDPDQATGVNNLLLKGTSMPHVLWRQQGIPELVHKDDGGEGSAGDSGHASGKKATELKVPEGAGTLSSKEYHRMTRDITNFLTYASEPIRPVRERMGVWVILFLLVFLGVAYLLKREYWRDVH
jgi:ubiquinol-cytochrome c reductase cytochrome c1 subunit